MHVYSIIWIIQARRIWNEEENEELWEEKKNTQVSQLVWKLIPKMGQHQSFRVRMEFAINQLL